MDLRYSPHHNCTSKGVKPPWLCTPGWPGSRCPESSPAEEKKKALLSCCASVADCCFSFCFLSLNIFEQSLRVDYEVGCHRLCALVLPSPWRGWCSGWYVGCVQARHLDRTWPHSPPRVLRELSSFKKPGWLMILEGCNHH